MLLYYLVMIVVTVILRSYTFEDNFSSSFFHIHFCSKQLKNIALSYKKVLWAINFRIINVSHVCLDGLSRRIMTLTKSCVCFAKLKRDNFSYEISNPPKLGLIIPTLHLKISNPSFSLRIWISLRNFFFFPYLLLNTRITLLWIKTVLIFFYPQFKMTNKHMIIWIIVNRILS